jgi:hypothetical protein
MRPENFATITISRFNTSKLFSDEILTRLARRLGEEMCSHVAEFMRPERSTDAWLFQTLHKMRLNGDL